MSVLWFYGECTGRVFGCDQKKKKKEKKKRSVVCVCVSGRERE
jgi:hypothetical protein